MIIIEALLQFFYLDVFWFISVKIILWSFYSLEVVRSYMKNV